MKLFLVLFSLAAVLSLSACSGNSGGQISESQLKDMLEKNPDILTNAIEKNPDKFMSAVQKAAQGAQARAQENAAREEQDRVANEAKNPLKPELDNKRASLGKESAPVTIVEYTDFQCPYCGRGYATMEEVRKIYGDKVRIVVKNLPLPMHPLAMPAAKRFEALKLQSAEKGFAFYHEVFSHQQDLSGGEAYLDQVAKKVGGDVARMKKDMDSDRVRETIDKDMAEAEKFGIKGTPGFIVNGVSVRGAYPTDYFKKLIDSKL